MSRAALRTNSRPIRAEAEDVPAFDRGADIVPRPHRRTVAFDQAGASCGRPLRWPSAVAVNVQCDLGSRPCASRLQAPRRSVLSRPDVHVRDSRGRAEPHELARPRAALPNLRRRSKTTSTSRIDRDGKRFSPSARAGGQAVRATPCWRGLRTKLSSVKLNARTPSAFTRSVIQATSRLGVATAHRAAEDVLDDAERAQERAPARPVDEELRWIDVVPRVRVAECAETERRSGPARSCTTAPT